MKVTSEVKGLKLDIKGYDVSKTYTQEGQAVDIKQTEQFGGLFSLESSRVEVEMDKEEYTHLITTAKEEIANFREYASPLLQELMAKTFTVLDNGTEILGKKIESDIKIAEFNAKLPGTEAPAAAPEG